MKMDNYVLFDLRPRPEDPPTRIIAYVDDNLATKFGDMILGLPGTISLGLLQDFDIRTEEHVLRYKNGTVKRIQGKLEKVNIAAVTQTGPSEKPSTKMVSPTPQQWEDKLKHIKDEAFRSKLLKLLIKYSRQFWISGYLPAIKKARYHINYKGPPFRERMIPLNKEDTIYMNDLVDDQLKDGLLVEITKDTHLLQYVSNMFLKYELDKKRPCINYVKLNHGTIKSNMPIPNKEHLIAMLAGGDFYILTDCKSAYNQLIIDYESRKYLVYCFPGRDGRKRFVFPTRANFGTSNMPGEYQRISSDLFSAPEVGVYLDDITIKGTYGEEDLALERFETMLQTAEEHGVTFSFTKTEIVVPECKVLGEIIDKHGRRPNPKRVKALREFPLPTTKKQLRGFLGLYNFLAPHKRHSTSEELLKLQSYTADNVKLNPTEMQPYFEKLKRELMEWVLLSPYNPNETTYLMSDSSGTGMGAVIFQIVDGTFRPIGVCSKKWTKRKRPYASHVKEGLALVFALRRFLPMLQHTDVMLLTDSENTVRLLTHHNWDDIPALWLRHRLFINNNFRASIFHVPGKQNIAADVLSRHSFISAIGTDTHDTDIFFSPLLRSIYDAQHKDETIRKLIAKYSANPHKFTDRLPKAYLFVQNGLLKRRHKVWGTQIVVPPSSVKRILYLYHDTELSGHPGVHYMTIQLKSRFYWHKMDRDIRRYVLSCTGCQLAKAKISRKHVSMAIRRASQIFSVFSMDLIDMGTTSGSYRYILVLMDYFTGFVLLYNLRNKMQQTVLNTLWDAFTIFGPPDTLLSDRGKEFLNALVEKFTQASGIRQVVTYAYHAQGNAKNERSHRVINDILRIFCDQHQGRWHKFTKGIQYIINSRPNLESTISPYEALFGMFPRPLANVSPFLEYNHDDMQTLRDSIRATVKQYTDQKLHAAAQPRAPPFQPGDLVKLVRTNRHDQAKLLHRASGPYKVIEPLASSGYRLQHTVLTDKFVDAPREWIQVFHSRKGDGQDRDVTESETSVLNESNESLMDEPERISQNIVGMEEENDHEEEEQELPDASNTTVKQRKELKEIAAYNQPTTKSYITEAEIGNMVIVKEDDRALLGEIIEDLDDTWKVHVFDTTTAKSLPRSRWKFYPRWRNTVTDKTEVCKHQEKNTQADVSITPKEKILLSFKRLHLNATIPVQVLDKISKLRIV